MFSATLAAEKLYTHASRPELIPCEYVSNTRRPAALVDLSPIIGHDEKSSLR